MQPADMEGILQQLDPPGEAKLTHGVGLVNFDRLVAQVEPRGDLLVAVALRDQPQYFRFTIAQHRCNTSCTFVFLSRERRREVMGQCWIDVPSTGSGRTNRSKKLGV